MAVANAAADYPISISVQPTTEPRNKMTVGFRIILAIPHSILVGGGLTLGGFLSTRNQFGGALNWGVLGAVAGVCALISWFAILFANQHPEGMRNLGTFYMRWKVRALSLIHI